MADTDAGIFFSSLLEGFNQERNRSAEQARLDKIAKLEGQLLTERIRDLQQRGQAEADLDDLLRPVQEFDITEQPSTGGRRNVEVTQPETPGLIDMLVGETADPRAQSAAVRAGLVDASDLVNFESFAADRAQRDQGLNLMQQFLGGGEGLPEGLTIGGVNVSPDGGLGLSFQPDPLAPSPIGAEIEGFNFGQLVTGAGEALGLFDILADTSLAPGAFGAEAADTGTRFTIAAKNFFGGDPSGERQAVAARETLDKFFQTVGEDLQRNATTDTARNAAIRRSPSIDKLPETNAKLLADYVLQKMAERRSQGLLSPQEEQLGQAMVERLDQVADNLLKAQQTPTTAEDVRDFTQLTLDQLQGIDVQALTNEQFEEWKKAVRNAGN